MATVEKSGTIKYKSTSGDTTVFYPNTLADNVSGLSDAVSSTANSVIDSKLTDINAHLTNKANPHNVTAEQIGALSSTPVSMASTDGAVYTCTVAGITSLTAGASFIGVPAVDSTSTVVKLNVSGLGEKLLRRRVSSGSATTAAGYNNDWLTAGKPLNIMYDGSFWVVDIVQPNANDLMGSVPVTKGGTGASDGATGLANLLAAGSTVLSSNQYGETLPTAGSAGRVFFKKSDGSDMEAINTHITDENNPHKVTAAQVGAISSTPVDILSSDGVSYTCTIPWIAELTDGVCFIGIPKRMSSSHNIKLNVNGLGDKTVYVRRSDRPGMGTFPSRDDWIAPNNPLIFMYDKSGYWIIESCTRPMGDDISGSVPMGHGGTGAVKGSTGLANLFADGYTKLSSYQYGDTLPTAGTAGRVFFKKSDDTSTAITTSNISSQTVNKANYATDTIAVGTPALRNQYFVSAEATPTVNGQIAWVYG